MSLIIEWSTKAHMLAMYEHSTIMCRMEWPKYPSKVKTVKISLKMESVLITKGAHAHVSETLSYVYKIQITQRIAMIKKVVYV